MIYGTVDLGNTGATAGVQRQFRSWVLYQTSAMCAVMKYCGQSYMLETLRNSTPTPTVSPM